MNKNYSVIFGEIYIKPDSYGDTWDPAWAEDDKLYCALNDGISFADCTQKNVQFVSLCGDNPNELTGESLNTMASFGEKCEEKEDNCTWKTSGCLVLDSNIYLTVGRHCYGFKSGDANFRQLCKSASIIMSSDKGKSWNRTADECYYNPEFRDVFTTPYFIHYGKNGDASEAPAEDEAEKFVYAISNSGSWDNGDYYILGRVCRENMKNCRADDWEYLAAIDNGTPVWSKSTDKMYKIIDAPLHCGETGATYIPAIGKYVLVAWSHMTNARENPSETRLEVYIADHPWGEWEKIGERNNPEEGFYCTRVLSKFITSREAGVQVVLILSGDYTSETYYRLITMPLTIKRETQGE